MLKHVAGSPNEDGQRTVGDFSVSNVRKLKISVMSKKNDDFETPRLDRAAYVFCVQSARVL